MHWLAVAIGSRGSFDLGPIRPPDDLRGSEINLSYLKQSFGLG